MHEITQKHHFSSIVVGTSETILVSTVTTIIDQQMNKASMEAATQDIQNVRDELARCRDKTRRAHQRQKKLEAKRAYLFARLDRQDKRISPIESAADLKSKYNKLLNFYQKLDCELIEKKLEDARRLVIKMQEKTEQYLVQAEELIATYERCE